MNKSKKFALAASAFLLLAVGFSSVSSGTTEKFVPLSEYNEQFAGQEQILIPINNYNRQFSSLEHSFVPIAEYNDTFSGQIQNFVPLTDYNNTFSGQVQDFVLSWITMIGFPTGLRTSFPSSNTTKNSPIRLMNIRLHPNTQVTPMPPHYDTAPPCTPSKFHLTKLHAYAIVVRINSKEIQNGLSFIKSTKTSCQDHLCTIRTDETLYRVWHIIYAIDFIGK